MRLQWIYGEAVTDSVGCIVIAEAVQIKSTSIIIIIVNVVFVWAQFAILIVQIAGMPPEQL